MILSRLISRAKSGNIAYGTVQSVNSTTNRLTVAARNDVSVSVSYSPTEFPSIAVGDIVAIGYKGMDRFLVSRVPAGIPSSTTILEV